MRTPQSCVEAGAAAEKVFFQSLRRVHTWAASQSEKIVQKVSNQMVTAEDREEGSAERRVSTLVRVLGSSPDITERTNAIKAIAAIGIKTDEAETALTGALFDKHSLVQRAAAKALGELGSIMGLQSILWSGKEKDPYIGQSFNQVVQREVFLAGLAHADPAVRNWASRQIMSLGPKLSARALIDSIKGKGDVEKCALELDLLLTIVERQESSIRNLILGDFYRIDLREHRPRW